jgi:hypothetical protein
VLEDEDRTDDAGIIDASDDTGEGAVRPVVGTDDDDAEDTEEGSSNILCANAGAEKETAMNAEVIARDNGRRIEWKESNRRISYML